MSRKIFNLKCICGHVYNIKYCQGDVGRIKNIYTRHQSIRKASSNSLLSAEHVLSSTNRSNCISLLKSKTFGDGTTKENVNKAAVLVPLCKVNQELALLYTVRAPHLKVNGGEVAFPGGMFDKSDGNLEQTAMREAKEEVGIPPDKVDVWGTGPRYFFKTMQNVSHEIHTEGITITPILGYIGDLELDSLKINSDEVMFAFSVTLAHLASPKNFQITRFRTGKNKSFINVGPVFLNPYKRIWGFTAYITHIILCCLIPDVYKKNISFKPNRVLGSKK